MSVGPELLDRLVAEAAALEAKAARIRQAIALLEDIAPAAGQPAAPAVPAVPAAAPLDDESARRGAAHWGQMGGRKRFAEMSQKDREALQERAHGARWAGHELPQPAPTRPSRARGSIVKYSTGWRFSIHTGGVQRAFPTRKTREEAESDQTTFLADRDADAAQPAAEVEAAPTKTAAAPEAARGCRACGKPGHSALTCKKVTHAERLEAARARRVDSAPTATEEDPPIDDDAIELAELTAESWSPPDADGRQTCIPCGGEGIDRREGGKACCLCCDGEGYRWPEGAAAAGGST